MGSASSKPARSAANAVSRRQYPKQPTSPPTASPAAAAAAAQPQSRAPPPPPREPQTSSYGATNRSKEPPSSVKSNAIDIDGRDPHFAASLRTIGPVNPVPTYSSSSTFDPSTANQPNQAQTVLSHPSSNPALLVLSARERIAKAAEQEAESFGRQGSGGREFLDALTIRQAMAMRDRQGFSPQEIESTMGLKKGVMDRLGRKGIVSEVTS